MGNFFRAKISPKSLGYFFLEKNSPNAIINRPNGEISPNLVTLFITEDYFTTGFLITTMYKQMLITDNSKNAQLAETVWLGLRSVLIKQWHKNIDEKCKMLIKIIK